MLCTSYCDAAVPWEAHGGAAGGRLQPADDGTGDGAGVGAAAAHTTPPHTHTAPGFLQFALPGAASIDTAKLELLARSFIANKQDACHCG